MNFITLLNIRTEWEDLVSKFNFPDQKFYHGTIESLEWFIKNGRKSNSLRDGFTEAYEKAEIILKSI